MFASWRLDGVTRPAYRGKTWVSPIWREHHPVDRFSDSWVLPLGSLSIKGSYTGLQPSSALGGYLASDKFLHSWLNKLDDDSGGECGPFLQSITYSNHCSWPQNPDMKWCRQLNSLIHSSFMGLLYSRYHSGHWGYSSYTHTRIHTKTF